MFFEIQPIWTKRLKWDSGAAAEILCYALIVCWRLTALNPHSMRVQDGLRDLRISMRVRREQGRGLTSVPTATSRHSLKTAMTGWAEEVRSLLSESGQ